MKFIDLRSDTVTRPTKGMKEAMMYAEVGDDVLGDDPTVNLLQRRSAEMFGKEEALFIPSGTMGNLISIRTHTEPGDEIIVDSSSHIYIYEGGGFAAVAGVSIRPVDSLGGVLDSSSVQGAIRPEGGLSHFPLTKLVCLENTSNRGGGRVYSKEAITEIGDVAKDNNLKLHLDGARVFNASIKSGEKVCDISSPFDSVSFCLSKGLGCPVGSVLVGSKVFIQRAHRFRKMFGGGMRQAGVLAGAGIYALENHIQRLEEDHQRAKILGEELNEIPGVNVEVESIATNMVYIDISGLRDPEFVVSRLEERGVLMLAVGPTLLRAVTHLDVDDDGITRAIMGFKSLVN